MDTNEIKSILEKNEATSGVFLNVYAADQLPKKRIERDRWLLIANCCPSNYRGEHWVAVVSENGQLEFFDSFGLPPDVYERVVPFSARKAGRKNATRRITTSKFNRSILTLAGTTVSSLVIFERDAWRTRTFYNI